MHDKYLGDSYDFVKRFWNQALSPIGPLFTHPRFLKPELRQRFTALTGILPFDESKPPEKPFGILLDPHTGIPLPANGQKTPTNALAPIPFIEGILSSYSPEFLICFDQSHNRRIHGTQDLKSQRETKRKALHSSGIHSFYYQSHASFLFMSRKLPTLRKIRGILIKEGIPSMAGGRVRLQEIGL